MLLCRGAAVILAIQACAGTDGLHAVLTLPCACWTVWLLHSFPMFARLALPYAPGVGVQPCRCAVQ